jgi:hypothetical protein
MSCCFFIVILFVIYLFIFFTQSLVLYAVVLFVLHIDLLISCFQSADNVLYMYREIYDRIKAFIVYCVKL